MPVGLVHEGVVYDLEVDTSNTAALECGQIIAAHGQRRLGQAVPPIRGRSGQSLRRPRRVYADRGHDHDVYRDKIRRLQITPVTVIAQRGTGHGSGLGVYRWVVAGAIALLHWFRRLRIRWEIRDDIHQALVTLGCAIVCWRRLKTSARSHVLSHRKPR